MPADDHDQWALSKLNQQIEQLERGTPELRAERAAAASGAARSGRRWALLRAARRLRAPKASMELWPVAVLTVGPIVAGALAMMATSVFTSALGASLLALVCGAAAGAGVLGWLLFQPPEAVLPAALAEAEAAARLAEARLKEATERLAAATAEHQSLVEQRRELMASGQVQRAALLQRGWKTMAAGEWGDFVVEVCRTLGYSAERASGSGAGGGDLIVGVNGERVSVVTQAAEHVVNSNAVQQAVAGKGALGCQRCAVVINRRFTGAAQEFARRQQCTLVGIEEFPDFALGTIQL
jgi:hypothetical protein